MVASVWVGSFAFLSPLLYGSCHPWVGNSEASVVSFHSLTEAN